LGWLNAGFSSCVQNKFISSANQTSPTYFSTINNLMSHLTVATNSLTDMILSLTCLLSIIRTGFQFQFLIGIPNKLKN